MFSDRLLALLAEQGDAPDYQGLAAEVLGIRGAPPALARKLVEQALLLTDWREHWRQVGQRAIQSAPEAPGVYTFHDGAGSVLYVGKAANLRRRLSAHFADRKWRALTPALARVARVEWKRLGSELEALLCEATLIRQLQPVVNVQMAMPSLETRAIPPAFVRDVVLLLPSVEPDGVEVVAARPEGATLIQRVSRVRGEYAVPAERVWAFFRQPSSDTTDALAPLVFSWLAGRGRHTSRFDPHDFGSVDEFRVQLERLLAYADLFAERIVTL